MIDQLIERIEVTKHPIVVGLDPRLQYIPAFIKKEAFGQHGKSPQGAAAAILRFNQEIIDSIYDIVPAVKPQIALYEQYGAPGIEAYYETIAYARKRGLIVIGDIKRGDIASTAEAYAQGHLGEVEIEGTYHRGAEAHSVTLNPYLGYDAIEPFLQVCKQENRGLFILVKTSNPNSGQLQNLKVGERYLYEIVGELVRDWGKELMGSRGYSQVGAVVGATYPEEAAVLRKLMPHSFFLVPGYGAQGAKAEDLKGCFNRDGLGALIASSRGIISAHLNPENQGRFREREFTVAIREATVTMGAEIRKVLGN